MATISFWALWEYQKNKQLKREFWKAMVILNDSKKNRILTKLDYEKAQDLIDKLRRFEEEKGFVKQGLTLEILAKK